MVELDWQFDRLLDERKGQWNTSGNADGFCVMRARIASRARQAMNGGRWRCGRLAKYGTGLTLPELSDVPCLALLGEPGMGKSYAVRREWARLNSSQQHNPKPRSVDLLGRDSSQSVSDFLFDSDFYRAWRESNHRLVYFIDSVDKSGADVQRVMAAIENELGNADLLRLRLRLVCRDHDWSFQFADALRSIWDRNNEGASNVQVLQLQPLGDHEIRVAAEAHGKDAEQFLTDVETANALPLATVPLTLNMLPEYGKAYQ